MKKNLFESVFGNTESEFAKMLNEWLNDHAELFADEDKNSTDDVNEDENDESYVHVKGKRYDNGKLVEKYDKKYVNGELVKDEEFNTNKGVEDKKNETCKCGGECKCNETPKDKHGSVYRAAIRKLEKENKDLKSQNDELLHYIDGLNDKIKSIQIENGELKSIIDNVKKCF